MGKISVILVLMMVSWTGASARNTFMFMAPKIIRPGNVLTVSGSLLKDPPRDVSLTVSIVNKANNNVVTQTTVTIRNTAEENLGLEVPRGLTKGRYSLKVEGSGGLTFTKTGDLQYEEKGSSLFIQLDKAKYKPGQTVNYRIFGVRKSLQRVLDKLRIDVLDPKQNKIQQVDISNSELTQSGGVYEGHLPMSDHPLLGDWVIKATLLSEGATAQKTFTIEKYVLPKYETKLDLPSFGQTNVKEFHGKVTAKYTHGNPVKGTVKLNIRDSRSSSSKKVELTFPINGKAEFRIATSKLRDLVSNLNNAVLLFEANVTEGATGLKEGDSEEIRFYDKTIKLEFAKSLPKSFNPGMKYRAVVKVAQQDDLPPPIISKKLKVTVTHIKRSTRPKWSEERRLSARLSRRGRFFPRPRPFPRHPIETRHVQPVKTLNVPLNGIVEIPLTIPSNVIRAEIKAEYDGIRATHTIKKRYSPSNSYLQVRLPSGKAKAGENVQFEIASTNNPRTISYQIFSKGAQIRSGTIDNNGKQTTLTVMVTSAMAPRARMLVHYVRSNGEVVADAMTFNVDGLFDNKVSLNFNVGETTPGSPIRLSVNADSGSKVSLLAVDKSVLLLQSGNDITSSDVRTELETYATPAGSSGSKRRPFCGWFCSFWPLPTDGDDVKAVFDQSGMLVLTDANVYDHKEIIHRPILLPRRRFRAWGFNRAPVMRMASRMRGFARAERVLQKSGVVALAAAPRLKSAVKVPTNDELQPVVKTRKVFPETWLWRSTVMSGGNWTLEETVPDTITSWVATAFALHPNTGLGVADEAARLTTLQSFFITASLPYSVVRGERVIVKVLIFNYHSEALFTRVRLAANPDFDNIHIKTENGITTSSTSSSLVTRTVEVQPNDVAVVYFPIKPVKLGRITLRIRGQNRQFSDEIEKQLLVEPEGDERDYNVPVLVDLRQTDTFSTTVNTPFPAATVTDSKRIVVTAVGDLMGPTAKNLDKLLKMSYGCGEQNMLNFAPNVFIMRYLEATDNINAGIMEKAKEYMMKGYQRELTYQHTDGAFSAFGDRDNSGSMWLTAFVLKSFVQAKNYIFVDENLLNKAVDWIIKKQNKDGTFPEPGRVIHKAMQGGSVSSQESLTSFVLIALVEAESIRSIRTKVTNAKAKALAYLEQNAAAITDLYELSIVSYALALAGSPQASTVWDALDSRATVEGGKKFWAVPDPKGSTTYPWEKRRGQGKAMNIEITSYALLSLAARNKRVEGLPIVKWLMSQRNPNGGFSSTQDTIVALQALSEMASELSSKNIDMSITVTAGGATNNFRLTALNSLVLQSVELPGNVGQVKISATGRGIGLVDVAANYHINDDDQNKAFEVDVTVPNETPNAYDVRVCARWLEKGTSSMSLIEIGTASGFFADTNSVVSNSEVKRVEEKDRKVVLYFDEIGQTDTCVTVTMQRFGMVVGAQPVPVHVIDYYEPGNQVTKFYIPKAVQNSDVCDVCGKDCDFCPK